MVVGLDQEIQPAMSVFRRRAFQALLLAITLGFVSIGAQSAETKILELTKKIDALRVAGDYQAAANLGREAILAAPPLDPDLPVLLHVAAAALLNIGAPGEAEVMFARAYRLREQFTRGATAGKISELDGRGDALFRLGDFQRAENAFRRSLLLRAELYPALDGEMAIGFNMLGNSLARQSRFPEAQEAFLKALTVREAGSSTYDIAFANNQLCFSYYSDNQAAKAERYCRAALNERQKTFSSDKPSYAYSLNELAYTLLLQSRFPEAEQYYQRAVTIRETLNSVDDLVFAVEQLANVQVRQGHDRRADEQFRRLIELKEKAKGVDSVEVANSLNELGNSLYRQSKFTEAQSALNRALEIKTKILGPDSPDVAFALGQLGTALNAQGRYKDAEPVYRRALAIRRLTQGNDRSQVAFVLNELAFILQQTEKLAEAEGLYREALEIQQAAYPPASPEVIFATSELAKCVARLGRNYDAERLLRQTLALQEQTYGIESLEVAESVSNLAIVLSQLGRLPDADVIHRRVVAIRESKQGPDHADTARAVNDYADNLLKGDRYADAAETFRKALGKWQRSLGPSSHEAAEATKSLAKTLMLLKHNDEAEKLFAEAIGNFENESTPEKPDLRFFLAELAKLQEKREDRSNAAVTRRKLAQVNERAFGARDGRTMSALNRLAQSLRVLQRFEDAAALYLRILAIQRADDKVNPVDLARTLNNLGWVYYNNAQFKEAASALHGALAIEIKYLTSDADLLSKTTGLLAGAEAGLGNFDKAEALLKDGIAKLDRNSTRYKEALAEKLANLGTFYNRFSRFHEAETAFAEALSVADTLPAPPYETLIQARQFLAKNHYDQGRYKDAEHEYEKTIATALSSPDPDQMTIASTYGNLGVVYNAQGRYADAERSARKAIAVMEAATGPDSIDVAIALDNLGTLYFANGLESEAETLMRRAMKLREQNLQPNHPIIAQGLVNLAYVERYQGRSDVADKLLGRALAINSANFGVNSVEAAQVKKQFADSYGTTSKWNEAQALYKTVIETYKKGLGADHPDVATVEADFGDRLIEFNQYDVAKPYYEDALRISLKSYGADHQDVAKAQSGLGAVFASRKDWSGAAQYYEQSTREYFKRRGPAASSERAQLADRRSVQTNSAAGRFRAVAKMTYQLHLLAPNDEQIEQSFVSAQWASQTDVSESLTKMSTRLATGNGRLAQLIRERQDSDVRWSALDKALVAAMAQEGTQKNAAAETALRRDLEVMGERIKVVDGILAREFPNYTAAAFPNPMSIGELQAQLHSDEVLLFFLDTRARWPLPAETFVWGVTKDQVVWHRLSRSGDELTKSVNDLRQALGVGSLSRSATILQAADEGQYDLKLAHELYRALFGQIEGLIRGKKLAIVPSPSLASLPFQILVTDLPAEAAGFEDRYRTANWLIRDHAITILPSVGALKVLRELRDRGQGSLPYLGIGNPLLTGQEGKDRRAWSALDCADRETVLAGASNGQTPIVLSALYRGAQVNVSELRRLTPLPETRDELCDTAKWMGVGVESLLMGPRATESEIKSLSSSGALAQYRVLHFATHGLISGEFTGLMEPAIVLSPPLDAADIDNGLLAASEVSTLKLNADWVILSACNTAAGAKGDSEALSGLANAFFYAGARSLMVTHWAVDSKAAVEITTQSFENLANEPSIGKAEALRRSMIRLIDSGGAKAHPSYWAPFVLVGDG